MSHNPAEFFEEEDLDYLDDMCKNQTGFSSFHDLVNAKGNYRPSVDVRIFEMSRLAESYDFFMEHAGDSRRAHRYGDES